MDSLAYGRAMTEQKSPRGKSWLADGPELAALAVIAGTVSYVHGLEVARMTGSPVALAALIAAVADLLIVGCSRALLDAANHHEPRPKLAAFFLVAAIGVTVAMNVAAGWRHGLGGALVSAIAPVAFVAALEIFLGRRRRRARRERGEPVGSQAKLCPHRPRPPDLTAAVEYFEHMRDCVGDEVSRRHAAELYGVNRTKLGQALDSATESDSIHPAVTELNGSTPAAEVSS